MKKSRPESDSAQRRAQQPANELNSETREWLQTLPVEVQPQGLATEYGRIVNTLRLCWGRPQACLDYFDDLLIDRRGNRQGFPGDIAMEIALLKDYYQTSVHAGEPSDWQRIPRKYH
jgi:hypothetical protein